MESYRGIATRQGDGAATVNRGSGADLTEVECLRHLGSTTVGRLGLTVASLPVITPIRYRVDGASAVFPAERASQLAAAISGDVACLEVEGSDGPGETWAVLATGRLQELTDPADLAHADGLGVPAWYPGQDRHFIRLPFELLSGRIIAPELLGAPPVTTS